MEKIWKKAIEYFLGLIIFGHIYGQILWDISSEISKSIPERIAEGIFVTFSDGMCGNFSESLEKNLENLWFSQRIARSKRF